METKKKSNISSLEPGRECKQPQNTRIYSKYNMLMLNLKYFSAFINNKFTLMQQILHTELIQKHNNKNGKFSLQQAMKAQKGSRGIGLLFL
jgi:hypothetical protein